MFSGVEAPLGNALHLAWTWSKFPRKRDREHRIAECLAFIRSSDAATVWVVNAYQLSATVCFLPVASLAESLGLKRVCAAGLAIFVLASFGLRLRSKHCRLW
jgi:MFS family permease